MFYLLFLLVSIGDSASYSKVGHCTSSFIRSIDATVEIVGETEEKFEIEVDYRVRFQFGSESDTISKSLDKYLFTEQFMLDLRENGTHEDDGVKVTHLERDGECDLVGIDVDAFNGDIEATICPGVPVLGIKSLRSEGEYSGVSFKACVELD